MLSMTPYRDVGQRIRVILLVPLRRQRQTTQRDDSRSVCMLQTAHAEHTGYGRTTAYQHGRVDSSIKRPNTLSECIMQ